jgi:diphosphomevalonate decarboxylase
MSDIQSQYVKNILADACGNMKEHGTAFAPSNIALCKYWGKRDAVLNLPVNSSLSISLGHLGTRTEIRSLAMEQTFQSAHGQAGTPAPHENPDLVYLNGQLQPSDSSFVQRTGSFLNLFRSMLGHVKFEVRTENNIPTAAGLASSASGFAALVMALDDLAGWGLDKKQLSMLARLGSGSAARSVYNGFVQWHAGIHPDGSDSFAGPLSDTWPEFRIGVLELSGAPKPIGSRDGMNRTVETSELYKSWPQQAAADLATIRTAIAARDFLLLGKTAERNALAMHATMLAAWPPLLYLQPETIAQIHKVQQLRAEGLDVYLTMDAGPNIKLLFLEENEGAVTAAFPGLQIIKPF